MTKQQRSAAAKALGEAGWRKKKRTFDPARMREIALSASLAAKKKRDSDKRKLGKNEALANNRHAD